jgi:hypothetical protein
VFFCTNLLQGGFLIDPSWRIPVGSTAVRFAGELISPPPEPYTAAAGWIHANVTSGESMLVVPDYMMYPLMFHAPQPLYAWQFRPASQSRYPDLPAVHFRGLASPDYLLALGPSLVRFQHNDVTLLILSYWRTYPALEGTLDQIEAWPLNRPVDAAVIEAWDAYKHRLGVIPRSVRMELRTDCYYTKLATLDTYWRDMYRPELFLRAFAAHGAFDPEIDGIQIFHKISNDHPQ